jgi:RND family efflux transporter MFP subunit
MAMVQTTLSTKMVMDMHSERQRKRRKLAIIIIIACLLLYFIVHHFSSKTPEAFIAKVVVQKPQWKEMVEYVSQTGTLVAYNSVDLVARIEGYLDSINFTDGSIVKKGQALFVIEPQPYYDQLIAAQANVAALKAHNAYVKSEYARQQRMYKQNATSLNNVESWLAKTQETAAEIQKAEAEEAIAAINYSYTHVLAPFTGRINRHLVDVGNLVGRGTATDLANIEQIDKLYVYFNLNEIDLIKLRNAARAMGFKPEDINQIPAYVKLQNETNFVHKGKLDFVNTGLNASTGTLEIRALLDNEDYALLPGLFVTVRIPISKAKKAMTVPDAAVLYDQIGPYLLTVNASSSVELKRVTLGGVEQGMRAITQGLNANDEVIIDGLQFATPGNKVEVSEQSSVSS